MNFSTQLKNSLLSAEHREFQTHLYYVTSNTLQSRKRSSGKNRYIYFVIKVYLQKLSHLHNIFGSLAILVPGRWNSLSRNAQLSGNIMRLARQANYSTYAQTSQTQRSFLRREFKPLIFLLKGHFSLIPLKACFYK